MPKSKKIYGFCKKISVLEGKYFLGRIVKPCVAGPVFKVEGVHLSKNKLDKFAENKNFSCMIEPEKSEFINGDFPFKGCWNKVFFNNSGPIVLELGCGQGDYSIALSSLHPEKNFIAIDIKGSRMWHGAKKTQELSIVNLAFLRTRVEFLPYLFSQNEVEHIWITFPDPHLRNSDMSKRLTSHVYLEKYCRLLKEDGVISLKTDSAELFKYTKTILGFNGISPLIISENLYSGEKTFDEEVTSIHTRYESRFLKEGRKIMFLRFMPGGKNNFLNPFSTGRPCL